MEYTASEGDALLDDIVFPDPIPRLPRDPREWVLARAYASLLVPEHTASGQWATWDVDRCRPVYSPSWYTRRYPVTVPEVHAALFRGDRVSAVGVRRVRYVTVDVDAHAAADASVSVSRVVPIDAHMRARSQSAKAARRRRAVRDAAWPTVERLLEVEPAAVPIQTKRGYHVVVLFDDEVDAGRAAAYAAHLASRVEVLPGVGVESYPIADRSGSYRTCAMPLTGSARIVASDGLRRVHRTRVSDVEWLLAHAERVAFDDVEPVSVEDGTRVPSVPVPVTIPVPVDRMRERALADDGCGLPQVKNRDADGRYTGAFRKQMVQVLARIEDDQSWRAVPKIATACFYLAVERPEAEAAFDAWVSVDHGATHAKTESGRRALRALFRHSWKRCARGVRDGWLVPGLMRAPEVRERIRELAAQYERREVA